MLGQIVVIGVVLVVGAIILILLLVPRTRSVEKELDRPARRPPAKRRTLAGDASTMSLADRMRALKTDRATGCLRVVSGDQSCYLYFLFGHVFHAECGSLEGEAALQTALGWPRVTSVFDKEATLPAKETITAEPNLPPN